MPPNELGAEVGGPGVGLSGQVLATGATVYARRYGDPAAVQRDAGGAIGGARVRARSRQGWDSRPSGVVVKYARATEAEVRLVATPRQRGGGSLGPRRMHH